MHSQPTSLAERGSTGPDDLLLVRRALRGEREAADALLARLACIHRFTYRLNRSLGYKLPTDCLEDVVQQVYIAVWPRLRDFAGSAAIESWVFGFCRNCLRAEVRRRRHGASSLDAGSAEGAPLEIDAPETAQHAAEQDEGVDALRAELARLHPDERAVVEMRFLHELSFEHIARALALPPSTIKDRCYRAMTRLKGRLRRRDHT
jgi:RNA polymerase sigma-70 factor (ECF subfamily)